MYEDNELESPNDTEYSSEDEELVCRVYRDYKSSKDHLREWRADMAESYDFFAGEQWSEDDKAALDEQGRPTIVFNRCVRLINAISGLELQNRQEPRFLPKETDDNAAAEVLQSAVKTFRSNCDAEDEESEAFQDALICGYGWTETRLDYETDSDGTILEERVDPGQMYYDPNAKKRNLTDATWFLQVVKMPKAEFKKKWPDVDTTVTGPGSELGMTRPHRADPEFAYEQTFSEPYSKDSRHIEVLRYQWYELEPIYRVEGPDGKLIDVEADEYKKFSKQLEQRKIPFVKLMKRVYKQAFIACNQVLEKGDCPIDNFTFNCITGFRDRTNNTFFGVIKLVKDPQRWSNKWLSQTLHILNSGAKNGIIAEEGAIPNQREFEQDWSNPGSVSYVADGALSSGKIQPKVAPPYPDGFDRLLQLAMQSIDDVPGVNPELLGTAGRDQAVRIEESRVSQGVTILAPLFDSLRRYRKLQGRVLAQYVIRYMTDGRLVRIVGRDLQGYVPLIKSQLDFKYDIIVDDAPTSPNMKEKVFGIFTQLMPVIMQAGIPIPPDILDYAPLPEPLIQKWKQMIKQSEQDPTKAKMQQLQGVTAELQAGKLQSEIVLNQAKAMKETAVAQDEGAQAQQKIDAKNMETSAKTKAMMMDQERKNAEFVMDENRKDAQLQRDLQREDIIRANRTQFQGDNF